MVFGLAVVLPVLVLSAVMARAHVGYVRNGLQAKAMGLAHNAIDDLDREIRAVVGMLEALVVSPELRPGALPAFYEHASRVARENAVTIILRDPAGQQILNSGSSPGRVLPESALPVDARAALGEGRMFVSDLYVGAVREKPVFLVSVPIATGVYAGHSLNAAVEMAFVSRIFATTRLEEPWGMAIFDRGGRLASATGETREVFEAGLAQADLARLTGEFGFVRGAAPLSADRLLGYDRSPSLGWIAVVQLPVSEWNAIVRASIWMLVLLTSALLALSLALASWFGSRLTLPMERLANQAAALGDALPLAVPVRSGIREIDTVAQTLHQSRERLAARTLELRSSEERFRQLAAASPAGIFRTDGLGKCTYLNAQACGLVGRELAEALGADWIALLHPDDRARVADDWLQCAARGEPLQLDCRTVRGDGEVRWIIGTIVAERTENGAVAGAVGLLVDLTGRRLAEFARDESDNRLRLALELGGMGTGTWDLQTGIAVLDPISSSIYGVEHTPAGLPLTRLLALVKQEDVADVTERLQRLTSTYDTVDIEGRIIRPDGEMRWIAIRAQQLRGDARAGPRVLGVLFDITRQKLGEESLTRLNDALELRVSERTREIETTNRRLEAEMKRREEAQAALIQAQKMEALGQLTGKVAHDFNNELTIISGGVELALAKVSDPQVRRRLQEARDAAMRAGSRTSKMLGFAHAGELVPSTIDVAPVLEELRGPLAHVAGSTVELAFDVEEGCWSAWTDRVELHTALLNLAVNARDAMLNGGKLTIAARNVSAGGAGLPGQLGPGDFVAISVSDTGVGMAAEILKRAPEPFFTTKPRGQGTGLGLASVKEFVEQSNGALEIVSAPGMGTTVKLYLPSGGARRRDADNPRVHLSDGNQLIILCVDDIESAGTATADLLRDLGHFVHLAHSPEAALDLARTLARLDVLVTDIEMAGMDGIELARRLSAVRPKLAVIYVTGHATLEVPPGTLRKPCSRDQLATKVVEVVGRATVRDV